MGNMYPGLRRRPTGRALEYADFQSQMRELRFQRDPFIDLEPFRRVAPKPAKPPLRAIPPRGKPPRGYEWAWPRVARDFGRVIENAPLYGLPKVVRASPWFRAISFARDAFELGNALLRQGHQTYPKYVGSGGQQLPLAHICPDLGKGLKWLRAFTDLRVACIGLQAPDGPIGVDHILPRGYFMSYDAELVTNRGWGQITVGPAPGPTVWYHQDGWVPARAAWLSGRVAPFADPPPLRWPQLAPELSPIAPWAPPPTPLPVPYRLLPEWRQNPLRVDQTVRGPIASRSPAWVTEAVGPTYEITEPMGEGGPPATIPPEHARAVPPRGTRERKSIHTATGPVAVVFGGLTEASDIVDCFMAALPKGHNRLPWQRWKKRLTFGEKLLTIWYQRKYIDVGVLSHKLVENEIEDRAFGGIGRGLKNLNRVMGRPVGVQTGPGAPGKLPDGFNSGQSPWSGWSDGLW